jgi:hypothetical protein
MGTPSVDVRPLNLHAGDTVEVRSEQDILATLDENGGMDGMPFMPEMLEFCGKRFRVYKRADKTCDTITVTGSRRIYDTVHLEGLRCTGQAHDGCQAMCLLYWKEAWLRRVDLPSADSHVPVQSVTAAFPAPARCNHERLVRLTRTQNPADGSEVRYRCQATDLLLASKPLPWWDVRQYVRDIRSGNARVLEVLRSMLFRVFVKSVHITAYRLQVGLYNWIQSWRGGTPYPYLAGTLDKTPRETLDLQPGELVQVKSYSEVLATLNHRNRNQGLLFDAEMVPYCGTVRRVLARVDHIIDERSGRMLTFTKDCLILAGAVCRAKYSDRRLCCPRSIYPYWREIWLKRAEETPGSPPSESD